MITGAAANVSGYVSIDGAAHIALAGPISELGFGHYVANLFAADTNGNNIGYFFTTASGINPVEKTVVTMGTFGSGNFYTATSGQFSGNVIGLVSGQSFTANTASIASGTIFIASGTPVVVYSGQLSGNVVNLVSGQSFTANTASIASGQVWIASGTTVLPYSGGLSGQFVNVFSGGIVSVLSGSLSGQILDLNSGQSWVAGAGSIASGLLFIASGTPVVVTGLGSGVLSGQFLDANLKTWLNSVPGVLVNGQVQATDSVRNGQIQAASANTVTLDLGAVATDDVYKGMRITVYSTTIPQSRLVIGYVGATRVATVTPNFIATPAPNSTYTLDEWAYVTTYQNIDKSGYSLSASGLDKIQIESGFNLRQALALVFAAECGMVSGAGTTLFNIGNMSGLSRIISVVDQSGNRSQPLVLAPPT